MASSRRAVKKKKKNKNLSKTQKQIKDGFFLSPKRLNQTRKSVLFIDKEKMFFLSPPKKQQKKGIFFSQRIYC